MKNKKIIAALSLSTLFLSLSSCSTPGIVFGKVSESEWKSIIGTILKGDFKTSIISGIANGLSETTYDPIEFPSNYRGVMSNQKNTRMFVDENGETVYLTKKDTSYVGIKKLDSEYWIAYDYFSEDTSLYHMFLSLFTDVDNHYADAQFNTEKGFYTFELGSTSYYFKFDTIVVGDTTKKILGDFEIVAPIDGGNKVAYKGTFSEIGSTTVELPDSSKIKEKGQVTYSIWKSSLERIYQRNFTLVTVSGSGMIATVDEYDVGVDGDKITHNISTQSPTVSYEVNLGSTVAQITNYNSETQSGILSYIDSEDVASTVLLKTYNLGQYKEEEWYNVAKYKEGYYELSLEMFGTIKLYFDSVSQRLDTAYMEDADGNAIQFSFVNYDLVGKILPNMDNITYDGKVSKTQWGKILKSPSSKNNFTISDFNVTSVYRCANKKYVMIDADGNCTYYDVVIDESSIEHMYRVEKQEGGSWVGTLMNNEEVQSFLPNIIKNVFSATSQDFDNFTYNEENKQYEKSDPSNTIKFGKDGSITVTSPSYFTSKYVVSKIGLSEEVTIPPYEIV